MASFCAYRYFSPVVFWRWWGPSGLLFCFERILREIRARHRTYITKVIQHPGRVVEIQFKKEKTYSRAGQYIFLNCPEISLFQYHPFTLTSAGDAEDFLSVHIRQVGDFTKSLAEALGCEPEKRSANDEKANKDGSYVVKSPTGRVLPRIMIDGPFGAASEDFYKFETIMLCGAGIGVTPFASILKSIWYRLHYQRDSKPILLRKV